MRLVLISFKNTEGALEAPPSRVALLVERYFFFWAFFAGAFLAAFFVAICLFSLSDGLQ